MVDSLGKFYNTLFAIIILGVWNIEIEWAQLSVVAITDFSTLMGDLSHVVLLEDGQLPHELSSPKTPSLLLNALLAHDVYKNLFRNPFFFLEHEAGDYLRSDGPGKTLGSIYHLMQDCKLVL